MCVDGCHHTPETETKEKEAQPGQPVSSSVGAKHLGAFRVPRTTSEVVLLLLGDAKGPGVRGEGVGRN